jgi:hypothetical protein
MPKTKTVKFTYDFKDDGAHVNVFIPWGTSQDEIESAVVKTGYGPKAAGAIASEFQRVQAERERVQS